MTVTIMVGNSRGNSGFDIENSKAVDLGYFWARTFFEEIGLNIDPDGCGMIGDHPITDFIERCRQYEGSNKSYAARIVDLCENGIRKGATRVIWA